MWTECTEEKYYDMLGAVPPAYQDHMGFLVGEAMAHRPCRVTGTLAPTFAAFITHEGKYYECHQALTVAEFRAFLKAVQRVLH